jgi:hypothetical protein
VSGTPGASTSAAKFAQEDIAQIGGDETRLRGLGDVLGIVVGGNHLGAARFQRVTGRKPPSRRGRTPRPSCRRRM